MFIKSNKFSKKRKPSISDFNKYLINSIKDLSNTDNINNSFIIPSFNPLNSIKPFNNPNKKLLLEKLDTSNFHKSDRNKCEQKSFYKTISYDNSEDLFMAQKLSCSMMSERNFYNNNNSIYYPKKCQNKFKNIKAEVDNNNIFNNITKEKTSSTDDDIISEASPLEIYNRKMEYISSVIKIQTFWRKYRICKKIKIYKFLLLIDKIIYKNHTNYIKLFFANASNLKLIGGKLYYKKNLKKIIIKKGMKLHIIKSNQNKESRTRNKINQISIKDKLMNKSNKKIKIINCWINLPLLFEKYIRNRILKLYGIQFIENTKNKGKEVVKQKQNKLLCKLINLNEARNLKQYMNIYKEKIINIKKQKQKIYYSLIKHKINIKNKSKIFDFKDFYKNNVLKDIIKKYRYTSIVQKYYLLWKQKSELNMENKKKKIIKIKKVQKNCDTFNNMNNFKDDGLNNVSQISDNISISSNNTLNSIQSFSRLKISLFTANKKMRIRKVSVDKNYYNSIENINNYIKK